jgi:flagellar hook assembly protein FlgD
VVNLEFSLAGAAEVQLDIFDSRGRLMTRLVDRHLATGPHTLRWHGLDSSGHPAPSGLYFARLTVADQVTTQKVVLAK